MSSNLQTHSSRLPDATKPEMDFLESSFFKDNGPNQALPTPAEVRALSSAHKTHPQPTPMKFEELNLIVKFGPHVNVVEAQCLWIIRKILHDEVPVPEVYGWRVDGFDTFIYMQLIRGDMLRDRWDSLSISDKTAVCDHLRQIMISLRQVEQDPDDPFIGKSLITRRTIYIDFIFRIYQPPCASRHRF